MTTYRMVYKSGCGDNERHLNVDAEDASDAIEVLNQQMELEGETLTTLIASTPLANYKKAR